MNFGSITVMTVHQLSEFAWGLANSKCPFLWVIRPDLVRGDSATVPQDFIEETKDRCLISNWCPQEQVLVHPSVGVFLTHCGWNSTLESISSGVPMMCWPFFAEQSANFWHTCSEWRVGMEIDSNVKRAKVERLAREMEGEEGREMKKRSVMWKKGATEAAGPRGSSSADLDKMIGDILREISRPSTYVHHKNDISQC